MKLICLVNPVETHVHGGKEGQKRKKRELRGEKKGKLILSALYVTTADKFYGGQVFEPLNWNARHWVWHKHKPWYFF